MFIEIKGVQFVNKGAELMLVSVVERIKQYWPEADIILEPTPLSPYKNRALLGAYQKLSLRKSVVDLNFISYYLPSSIRNYLKKWGLVTEADIDVVLDASGFAYGDQWGAFRVKHLGGELKRYKKNGCKYILLPQAFGPFSRSMDQKILKESLPKAALICTREEDSYKHVRALIGDAENLKQFPDFTNVVKGIVPEYWIHGQNKVCFIPNCNMISAKNKNESWKKNYIPMLTLLIKKTLELGLKPVLLNHEGDGDKEICNILNSQFNNDLELIEECDPLKVKGIIGTSKVIVCSRFHGCVSALSQGVVCLGTSWSHKYEQLFKEYESSDLLMESAGTDEHLLELFEKIIAKNDDFKTRLESKSELYKKKSDDMWETVHSIVGNS